MIYFVTKRTTNELTKIFLKFYRFVDDFALGNSNKYTLLEAAIDLEKALNSLDFHLKRVISNQGWHLEEDVKRLGPVWNVPVSPGEIEQIFGHFWNHNIDKIQPKLQLFVGNFYTQS